MYLCFPKATDLSSEGANEILEGSEVGAMVETEQDATYGIPSIPIVIEEEDDDGTDHVAATPVKAEFEISAERLEALSLLAEAVDGGDDESHRKLLDALSTEERKLFFTSVADGSLSGLVKPWKPWWNFPLPKVVPVAVQVGDSKAGGDEAPDLARDRGTLCCGQVISAFDRSFLPNETKKLESMSTRKPSPLLRFNVVDVLLAYVKVRFSFF